MDVGIRILKARLSEFVDRAARGELIRVTDRGRPKALLVPLSGPSALADGLSKGWLTRENGTPPRRLRSRMRSRRSVAALLSEDRRE